MYRRRIVADSLILILLAALAVSGIPPAARAGFDLNGAADLAIGAPGDDLTGAASTLDAGALYVQYARPVLGLLSGADAWDQDQATADPGQGGPGEIAGQAELADEFGYALAAGDFDGNRFVDLAVGVHREGIDTAEGAGAVNILYGRQIFGLSYPSNAVWHQDSGGMEGGAEIDDGFGQALAVGDFNGDGYDDLAIGVPYEDVGSPAVANAGAVQIMYGSEIALNPNGNEILDQGTAAVQDFPEADDAFGMALTAGDFDGDGYDDLAVGVPFEDVGTIRDAGAVQILYGAAGSGVTARDQIWTQNGVAGADIQDQPEVDDVFGYALAAGDFDGDGYDDLAIGVPGEATPVPEFWAGAVHILRGSPDALTASGNQLFDQDDLAGETEAGDDFGFALATGDFDGDGYDDLAVGVPFENYGPGDMRDAGTVTVVYGTLHGLNALGSHSWSQNSPGIEGGGEADDQFGRALAVGDFDWDGYDDLAIGVPFEDVPSGSENYADAGAVNVLYGTRCGLCSDDRNQMWTKYNDGGPRGLAAGDRYGWALAAAPGMMRRARLPQIVKD